MVRREWRAEFPSHHAQSLPMDPEDKAMTRYWQYYVGQTIHAHLYILEVVKSFKTGDGFFFGMVTFVTFSVLIP